MNSFLIKYKYINMNYYMGGLRLSNRISSAIPFENISINCYNFIMKFHFVINMLILLIHINAFEI